MKNNICIKKSDLLDSLDAVYDTASLDYLIALWQGLAIIIKQRKLGGFKPYNEYFKGRINIKL